MNIKFYAPVNCIVKTIDKCTDQTFSNKFLGDGFLILPKNGNFKFPFDQGTCKMIFDTKHAYGFDVMGFDVLIHCGLETVNLKGQPFETNLNINQDLQKGQDLFIVNLDSIKKADLSIETPIVFDLEKVENFDLIDFKEGEYKQGDLICTVNIKEKELKIEDSTEDKLQKVANENYELQLKEFRTKYEIAAEYFLKCVGGPSNFSKVYNCMTRLRFTVKNKDIVDQTSIKKDKLVKGINWAGNELQIIIGGECYKVREKIEILMTRKPEMVKDANIKALTKTKKTFSQKFFTVVGAVMIPNIPVLMAIGLVGGIFGILNSAGWMEKPGDDAAASPWYAVMLYAMYNTGLLTIGVYFSYNVVKFMGGNPLLGILLGGILCSRLLLGTTGATIGYANIEGQIVPCSPTNAEYDTLHFGEYVSVTYYSLKGFYMFHIGDYPVLIRCYEQSILPFIVAAILFSYADRWIKKWMPAAVDICFRPPLAIIIAIIPTFFLLAPISSLVEFGILKFFQMANNIPFGLGAALFACMWMPLVITGCHVAVGMAIALPIYMGHPSVLWASTGAAGIAQAAATLAVVCKTRNKNLKSTAGSAIVAAYFGGIAEPMIYGINLPKVIPFLCGVVAAFFGGWIYGINHVAMVYMGIGIFPFNVVNFVGFKQQLWMVLATLITLGISFGLTFVFYRERTNEVKLAKKTILALEKLALINVNLSRLENIKLAKKSFGEQLGQDKEKLKKYFKFLKNLKTLNIKNKDAKYNNKTSKIELIEKQKKDLITLNQNLIADINVISSHIKILAKELINEFIKIDNKESSHELSNLNLGINFESDYYVVQNIFTYCKPKAQLDDLNGIKEIKNKFIWLLSENKNEFKKYEKYLQKLIDIENKITKTQEKEEKTRTKLYNIASKVILNDKMDMTKKRTIVEKYNNYSLQDRIDELTSKKYEHIKNNEILVKDFNTLLSELELDAKALEGAYFNVSGLSAISSKANNLWNAINTVQIGYNYLDPKNSGLTKLDKNQIKEIKKLSIENKKRNFQQIIA